MFQEYEKMIVIYATHALELMGMFIIIESALRVFICYVRNLKNADKELLKREFAESVLFALDFKLASEIIKTVAIRSMDELFVLGAVVGIRVILTLVLQWEIQSGTQLSSKK